MTDEIILEDETVLELFDDPEPAPTAAPATPTLIERFRAAPYWFQAAVFVGVGYALAKG